MSTWSATISTTSAAKRSGPPPDALYSAHSNKPFAFPEWGLWGIDDPSFVTQMAEFVHSHARTKLLGYYSGRPGSIFDLATKTRSLAFYRKAIAPLGR